MTEFSNLGQYLKQKRLGLKLTQSELAGLLKNIHIQFVSNWERGLCAPPAHCLENLIEVLDLSREKLVKVMVEDSRIAIEAKVFAKPKAKKKAV